MLPLFFASTEAGSTAAESSLPLGLDPKAFIVQLVTFVLVFVLLKKFAFKPLVKLLEKRHEVIEDGVKLGQKMENEQAKLKEEATQVIRDARHEGEQIIAGAHKEGREIIREAEKAAQRKTAAMLTDSEARIEEDTEQARRKLKKEIANLVAEAASAIVEEKVDAKKDEALIDRAMKGQK